MKFFRSGTARILDSAAARFANSKSGSIDSFPSQAGNIRALVHKGIVFETT
jgi:hypothetical protein